MKPQSKHVITNKEMRKLLGTEYTYLSEQQVEQLITDEELMAEIIINHIKKVLKVPNST